MENSIENIKLDPRQRKKAADVVVAAFYDYPMFASYFPEGWDFPWFIPTPFQHSASGFGAWCANRADHISA